MPTRNWSKLALFTLLLADTVVLLAIASPVRLAQADEGADHLVPVEELPAPPTDPVTPALPTHLVVTTPPDPTRCWFGWANLTRTEMTRAEWSDLLAMGALRTNPASGQIEVLSEIGACEFAANGCKIRWAHYSSSPFEARVRKTGLSQAERQRMIRVRVLETFTLEEGRSLRLPDGTWEVVYYENCDTPPQAESKSVAPLPADTGTGLHFWSAGVVVSGCMGGSPSVSDPFSWVVGASLFTPW